MIELILFAVCWGLLVKVVDKKVKLKDENDRCVP